MKNLIITTPGTSKLTSDISRAEWITIGVDSYQLNNYSEIAEVILADISSSFNFATFSDNSFAEFEAEIIGSTALFSDDFFPIGTYGINLGKMPHNVLESSTLTPLTPIQKAAIALAMSCQNEGYYVVVAVTDEQTTFRDSLREYNISSAAIKDIRRILK